MRMQREILHTQAHEIFITQKARPSQNSKNYIVQLDDLDLQTRPRYYQGQSMYQISWPYAKQFSCESANWQTARQKVTFL